MDNQTHSTLGDFSVLMTVYHLDKPEYLIEALKSIYSSTLLPREIILVKDGKLTNELNNIIREWVATHKSINIIELSNNVGLGLALAEGIKHCNYELIARMDSDDICAENRFAEQVHHMMTHPEISVHGGFIAEFYPHKLDIQTMRKLPLTNAEIKKAARYMTPMNHVTVMFRKSAILSVGGYRDCKFLEDYDLWIRMLMNGHLFSNSSNTYVYVRIGPDMLYRRKSIKVLKSLLIFNYSLWKKKFIPLHYLFYNCSSRIVTAITPVTLLRLLYIYIRRVRKFT